MPQRREMLGGAEGVGSTLLEAKRRGDGMGNLQRGN